MNVHAELARAHKVLAVLAFLNQRPGLRRLVLRSADVMTQDQWDEIAELAGVNRMSLKTRGTVLATLGVE